MDNAQGIRGYQKVSADMLRMKNDAEVFLRKAGAAESTVLSHEAAVVDSNQSEGKGEIRRDPLRSMSPGMAKGRLGR